MPDPTPPTGSRREFLTGKALRKQVEAGGELLADELTREEPQPPVVGDVVKLETRAMACDFAVIMNPAPPLSKGGPGGVGQVPMASDALEVIHDLEAQMTVYRDDSELAEINRNAAEQPVIVEEQLFALLKTAARLCEDTGGAFDPTAGPLIDLWKRCRADSRIPTAEEIAEARGRMGIDKVLFNDAAGEIQFTDGNVSLDLGGIGKGYALDRAAQRLYENGLPNFLFHGGHSSLIARGEHTGCDGWPVGIRDPFFPKEDLATVVLRDQALSTSGSGVQFFRHAGKRYGHILDPRTGLPAEGMLSVTVIASTAAEADALSTAFFVMGLENARSYCDNHRTVGAILIPLPATGRTLEPVVCNLNDGSVFFR